MKRDRFALLDKAGEQVGIGEVFPDGGVQLQLACGRCHHVQNIGEVLFLEGVSAFRWETETAVRPSAEKTGQLVLPLKPVSVNRLYTGRRFLSKEGRQFKADARLLLFSKRVELLKMKREVRGEGALGIRLTFGLSRDMDTDNCLKLVIDSLSDVLGIDDKRFRRVAAEKEKVKRGGEFIALAIEAFQEGARR